MAWWPNENLLDADNPLLKRVLPVALTIACRGFCATSRKDLVTGAAVSLLLAPIGWLTTVATKILHLAIVVGIWWFARDQIALLGISENTVLILMIVGILYKEIYSELLDLSATVLVLVTGGQFLRWMSEGYLSGSGLRAMVFTKEPMEHLVGVFVNTMSVDYRYQYEKLMELYLDSNRPESVAKLNDLLDEHSSEAPAGNTA